MRYTLLLLLLVLVGCTGSRTDNPPPQSTTLDASPSQSRNKTILQMP
jgi:hypothetical protein